jgi:putative endonuclease
MYEHHEKVLDGFSKRYNLFKLVHYEEFEDILRAIKREKGIKNLSRSRKMDLVINKNPQWLDLSGDW